MIQAIPTVYNGVQFRSRTEARWAVFFDALGIRWFYEHEGYQLPEHCDGDQTYAPCNYLPDFWLPEIGKHYGSRSAGTFLEVKGQPPTDTERSKCRALTELTSITSYIAVGGPGQTEFLDQFLWRGCDGWVDDTCPQPLGGACGVFGDNIAAALSTASTKRFW